MIEIPNYTIERELGRGGMATVYLAVQDMLSRHVALKVMLPDMARDENFRKSFLSEGKIIANLEHPNVVRIHDVGVIDDSILYMAMEYLAGGTLKEKLTQGKLSYAESLKTLEQTASGLEYAHSKGYIHRDVKPGNILFRDNGTCVITDFGIAKLQDTSGELTRMGYTMGTVQYMSPEQAVTTDLDHRSDIYSLGLVFYEMLTGKKAFKAESTIQAIHQHTTVAPPELPAEYSFLQTTIDKVLAKEPDDRYQAANEFVDAVKNAANVDKTVVHKIAPSNDEDRTEIFEATGPITHIVESKGSSKKLVASIAGGAFLLGAIAFGVTKYPDFIEGKGKDIIVSKDKQLEDNNIEEMTRKKKLRKEQQALAQQKIKKEQEKANQNKALAEQERLKAAQLAKDKEVQKQEEQARLIAEQKEQERLRAEQLEKDKEAQKQEEQAKLIAEQKEQERLKAEQLEKDKEIQKQEEQARLLAEQKQKEQLEAEQLEKDKEKQKQEEQARLKAKKVLRKKEKERLAALKRKKLKKEKKAALARKKAQQERKRIDLAKKKAEQDRIKKNAAKRKAQQAKKQKAAQLAQKRKAAAAKALAKKKADAVRARKQPKKQQGNRLGQIQISVTLNGKPLNTKVIITQNGKKIRTLTRAKSNNVLRPGRYLLTAFYGGESVRAVVNLGPHETAFQRFAFKQAAFSRPRPQKAPPVQRRKLAEPTVRPSQNKSDPWEHEHTY